MNEKNVKISLNLLTQTIYVLEHINMDGYDDSIKSDYDNILFAFYKKKESLRLREAYAKIIHAKDEDSRHFARMEYLQRKNDYRRYY